MAKIENTRGSQWLKWDLHIHTSESDGSGSPEEIVNQAVSKGLSVIAITDHHTSAGIDKVREAAKNKLLTVISGIEFRSEYGSKSVHFIGYFPDTHNGQNLDSTALHDLILSPLELSRTAIIAKGSEGNSQLTEEQKFHRGMFLVQVDFKKAADLIHKYGGLVSVHNGDKENGLDREIKHKGCGKRNVHSLYDSLGTMKEELMRDYIDICDIDTMDDGVFYLQKFNTPSIIASDAHKFCDIGSRFTWIKALPTFDGLKQIIYEPESRVRIQDSIPDEKPDYHVIDKISFCHKDFGEQVILLNPNLNTIIGGRSSGKSILLGSIAKKCGYNKKIKDSDIRNSENGFTYDEYIQSICESVNIKWRDEKESCSMTPHEDGSLRKISFYRQSEINGYACNQDEINKIVERIVIQDKIKSQKQKLYSTFVTDNQKNITNKIQEYIELRNQEKIFSEKIKELGSEKGIQDSVNKLNDEVRQLRIVQKGALSDQELYAYNEHTNMINTLTANKDRLLSDLQLLETLKNTISFQPLGAGYSSLSIETRTLVKNYFECFQKESSEKWNSFIQKTITDSQKTISKDEEEIKIIENSSLYKKGTEYLSKNEVFDAKSKSLNEERLKLGEMKDLIQKRNETQKSKCHALADILQLHMQYYEKADELAKILTTSREDVSITASVHYIQESLGDKFSSTFNKRSGEGKNYSDEKFENSDQYARILSEIEQKLDNEIILPTNSNLQSAFTNIFAESPFGVTYNIKYQNDDLNSMSEGKKAFIVLRLLLDFDESQWPILIDQPEDDLDNRAIYNDLVKYIRDKKTKRQIILVTHNPNVVVGADAELVIVANRNGAGTKNPDDINFCYYAGALEDSFINKEEEAILYRQGIREHVCDILEGGTEAFKKREQKYEVATSKMAADGIN